MTKYSHIANAAQKGDRASIMHTSISFIFLVAAVLQSEQAPTDRLLGADEILGEKLAGAQSDTGWQPVYIDTDAEIQTILYGSYIDEGADTSTFLLREEKKLHGVWSDSVYAFTAPYAILDACSEKKDIFYLLGKEDGSPQNAFIIERWKKRSITKAGGPTLYYMNRFELYNGSSFRRVTSVAADPDGRFLLVLSKAPTLLRKLFPNGSATAIFDVATIGHLDSVVHMTPLEHDALGRVWVLEGGADWTLLIDTDNDGVFDDHQTVDLNAWKALYALDRDAWTDDFLKRK